MISSIQTKRMRVKIVYRLDSKTTRIKTSEVKRIVNKLSTVLRQDCRMMVLRTSRARQEVTRPKIVRKQDYRTT